MRKGIKIKPIGLSGGGVKFVIKNMGGPKGRPYFGRTILSLTSEILLR